MVITDHVYLRAMERMWMTKSEVDLDIHKWMQFWCKKRKNWDYLMRWRIMNYMWRLSPTEGLVLKTAIYKSPKKLLLNCVKRI